VNNIAKWNGSTWSALSVGMNDTVQALIVDGNGNLYAGGSFTTAGGVAANYIAKWNGSAWNALGAGLSNNGFVRALAIANNNIYAGGYFASAGGVVTNSIAKWDGSEWTALGSGLDLYSTVYALAFDKGGNLYTSGLFTIAGDKASGFLAKWLVPDSDSDGVNDSLDTFPNNAAATTDADHDGFPDFWSQPNVFGCSPAATTCNVLTLDTTPPPMVLNTNYKGSSIRELQTLQ
jgi:hypothetical protein